MDEEERPFYELDLKKNLIPIIGHITYSKKIIQALKDKENLKDVSKAYWNQFTLGIYNLVLLDFFGATMSGNSLIVKLFE